MLRHTVRDHALETANYTGYVGTSHYGKPASPAAAAAIVPADNKGDSQAREIRLAISPTPGNLNAAYTALLHILKEEGQVQFKILVLNNEDNEEPGDTRGREVCISINENSGLTPEYVKNLLLKCWSALEKANVAGIGYSHPSPLTEDAITADFVTPFAITRRFDANGESAAQDAADEKSPLVQQRFTAADLRRHDLSLEHARKMELRRIANAKKTIVENTQQLNERIVALMEWPAPVAEAKGELGLRDPLLSTVPTEQPAASRVATDDAKKETGAQLLEKDLTLLASKFADSHAFPSFIAEESSKKDPAAINHRILRQIPLEKLRTDFQAAWTNIAAHNDVENQRVLYQQIQKLQKFNAATSKVDDMPAFSDRERVIANLRNTYRDFFAHRFEFSAYQLVDVYQEIERNPASWQTLFDSLKACDLDRTALEKMEAAASTWGRLKSWFSNNKFYTSTVVALAVALGFVFPPLAALALIPLIAVAVSPALRTLVQANPIRAGLFILGVATTIMTGPIMLGLDGLVTALGGPSLGVSLQTIPFFENLINVFSVDLSIMGTAASAVAAFTSALWAGVAAVVGFGWGVSKCFSKPAVEEDADVSSVNRFPRVGTQMANMGGGRAPATGDVAATVLRSSSRDNDPRQPLLGDNGMPGGGYGASDDTPHHSRPAGGTDAPPPPPANATQAGSAKEGGLSRSPSNVAAAGTGTNPASGANDAKAGEGMPRSPSKQTPATLLASASGTLAGDGGRAAAKVAAKVAAADAPSVDNGAPADSQVLTMV